MKRCPVALGGLGCGGFSAGRDMNGMLWERVTADQGPESGGKLRMFPLGLRQPMTRQTYGMG
jgi:hypothetical protein